MPRLRLAALAFLLAVVCSGPATPAKALSLSCPGQTSQPFLPWLDPFHYTLANGGDVNAEAHGWTLKNARSILSSTALNLSNTGERHVLSLASGATATSPDTCIAVTAPTLRFMVRSTGSPLGLLTVSAIVRDGSGLLETLPLGVVTGLGSSWKPSLPMVLSASLIPTIGDDQSVVRFRFTTTGIGASFEIDDLYVDPYRRG